jgi:hypothetical protein
MKGWLLLLVFLIWLRLTLGLTLGLREGFDANFKRLIPIDLDKNILTIPSTINNALIFDTLTLKHLKVSSLNASSSSHTTLNASSLAIGSKMTCPDNTLVIEGPLNMASLQTSSLIVQGVLQMGGWNIQTGDHLHIRKGQGTQIANDGNIHLDNRGWVTDIMTGVLNDRSGKIHRERERRAEEARRRAAAEAAQRAWEATQRAIQDAARNVVKNVRSWRPW